jgi:hypothetical protein
MAAKRDISGVFDAELKSARKHKAAVLDSIFQLSHKGMTFFTEKYMPEWTEVGIEMEMPVKGAARGQQVSCRGVVVQCSKRLTGKGFEVSLLFLDLPKRAETQLNAPAASQPPMSISIAR